jgi:putative transposase
MATHLPKENRKTCQRINLPGHAHALTFSCFQRRQFLSKPRTCQWFLESIDRARRLLEFDVWAYVIMPEHCHVLIYPQTVEYSISRILEAIKLPVTRRAGAYLRKLNPASLQLLEDRQPNGKVAYRFWQRGGGYDRNLVEEGSVYATIEYIHANPVRRGLVKRAQDWLWSSAGYYAGVEEVVFVPDLLSLPRRHPVE